MVEKKNVLDKLVKRKFIFPKDMDRIYFKKDLIKKIKGGAYKELSDKSSILKKYGLDIGHLFFLILGICLLFYMGFKRIHPALAILSFIIFIINVLIIYKKHEGKHLKAIEGYGGKCVILPTNTGGEVTVEISGFMFTIGQYIDALYAPYKFIKKILTVTKIVFLIIDGIILSNLVLNNGSTSAIRGLEVLMLFHFALYKSAYYLNKILCRTDFKEIEFLEKHVEKDCKIKMLVKETKIIDTKGDGVSKYKMLGFKVYSKKKL